MFAFGTAGQTNHVLFVTLTSAQWTYLDLAWSVTQASSLTRGEHGDHLVQASFQRAKHLPTSLFLSAVSCNSHVQWPRSGKQTESLEGHLIKVPTTAGVGVSFLSNTSITRGITLQPAGCFSISSNVIYEFYSNCPSSVTTGSFSLAPEPPSCWSLTFFQDWRSVFQRLQPPCFLLLSFYFVL